MRTEVKSGRKEALARKTRQGETGKPQSSVSGGSRNRSQSVGVIGRFHVLIGWPAVQPRSLGVILCSVVNVPVDRSNIFFHGTTGGRVGPPRDGHGSKNGGSRVYERWTGRDPINGQLYTRSQGPPTIISKIDPRARALPLSAPSPLLEFPRCPSGKRTTTGWRGGGRGKWWKDNMMKGDK